MAAPVFSVNPQQGLVDSTQVKKLKERFLYVAAHLGPSIAKVTPEFGAYMAYSGVLELGRKDGKLKPRPHIVPAIQHNAQGIVKHLLDSWTRAIKVMMAGTSIDAQKETEDAWIRALNSRPRIEAVKNAPFQYGFHRRSIMGYAKRRSDNDIKAEQDKAMKERAVAVAEGKAKGLAGAHKKSRKKVKKKS